VTRLGAPRAGRLWVHAWSGPSEAVAPSLVGSLRSDLELAAGVQLFGASDGAGQYGGLPPLWFVRADVYFRLRRACPRDLKWTPQEADS